MKAKRLIIHLYLAGMVALCTGSWAIASDHEPPVTRLRKGGTAIQKGYLLQSCWIYPSDDGQYIQACGDSKWDFPAVDRTKINRILKIRVRKAQAPTDFFIRAWRRLDDTGTPKGKSQRIDFELAPVLSSDEDPVAWDAVFALDEPGRHFFIRAGGYWTDEEGSGGQQDAFWTFHIKTKPS